MKNQTKNIALMGVLASLYFVMTVMLAPLAYGPLQFRVADILQPFVLRGKKQNIAIALGTFLANLHSPFGIIDWGMMPIVSIIAGFLAYQTKKMFSTHKYCDFYGMFVFAFVISLGVGLVLYVGAGVPYIYGMFYVWISGLIANFIGVPIVNKVVSALKLRGVDI